MTHSTLNHNTDPFVRREIIHPYLMGKLDGLSFAVKDNIDIKDQVTGYGSPGWKDTHYKPVCHAICLEQLLCEGGTLKGKTKSDELAYSLLGINSFYGTPLNPNAPDRVPGGSSSGSASAVASGFVDFALGTDTGGSVRVPASNCGVWGYRPTHGAISMAGVLTLASSFDTVGVMAQNGKILEKVMQVLLSEGIFRGRDIPNIYFLEDCFQVTDPSILEAVQPFIDGLKNDLKAENTSFSEITGKKQSLEDLFLLLGSNLSTEIWNMFGSWVKNEKPELSFGVERSLSNYAESASREKIQKNLVNQGLFKRDLNQFIQGGHVLCFPTTIDLAPIYDKITTEFFNGDYIPRTMSINAISSLSGSPQITIPLKTLNGVPVGLSFLAEKGQDMMLIDLCKRLHGYWERRDYN